LSSPPVSTKLTRIATAAATCHALGRGTAQGHGRKAGADEPYEGIVHVRVCGGAGATRLLPGSQPTGAAELTSRLRWWELATGIHGQAKSGSTFWAGNYFGGTTEPEILE